MRIISVFIILISIVSCTHKHEPLRYEKLNVDKQTKHLIDSTLAVIQQLSFTTDTTFGQSTGDKQGKVDVQINCLDSVGCFASIFIDNDSTGFAEAFIFKIDKPSWTYIHHIDELSGHFFDLNAKDYNFDGKIDVSFAYLCSCSRIYNKYYVFDYHKDYKFLEEFHSTDSVEINKNNKTITLFTDGGSFGTQETRIYTWYNGDLKLIEQFDQSLTGKDFVLEKEQFDDFKEYGYKVGDTIQGQMNAYLFEHYKLIGDSMTLVSSEIE